MCSNKTLLSERNQWLDLAPSHSFPASDKDYYLYCKKFIEKIENINCDCYELWS